MNSPLTYIWVAMMFGIAIGGLYGSWKLMLEDHADKRYDQARRFLDRMWEAEEIANGRNGGEPR